MLEKELQLLEVGKWEFTTKEGKEVKLIKVSLIDLKSGRFEKVTYNLQDNPDNQYVMNLKANEEVKVTFKVGIFKEKYNLKISTIIQ